MERYEHFYCRQCSGKLPTCQHCLGTGFEPTRQAQHERMKCLMRFARQYDIALNPDPLAIFQTGSAGMQIWCTPEDRPPAWGEAKMIKGVFSKPCAYVGSAYWQWTNDDDEVNVIKAIGISTDAYFLRDHRLVAREVIRNRPADIEWLKAKIEWLWKMTEVTWPMPPIVVEK